MVLRHLRHVTLRPIIRPRQPPKTKKYRELRDPFDHYDDDEIAARYRFDKATIQYLEKLLGPDLERPTKRGRAIPVRIQILAALRYYATGTFLNAVGDILSISSMSVSRIVTAVSYALARKMDQFITFPTGDRAREVMRKFGEKGGIGGIVGAIDCTHVRIVTPKNSQLFYMNRKGYHSMNIQAVCDADRCFTSILAKFPGSAHDSRIFSQSSLCADFERGRKSGILLGDAGYACKPYLLTPYDHACSRQEGRFNKRHARQRVIIEQAFGCLKRRFHIVHGELRLPSQAKVCAVIVACCVLHNLAIRRNLPDFYNVIDDRQPPEEAAQADEGHGGRSGPVIRDEIARLLALS